MRALQLPWGQVCRSPSVRTMLTRPEAKLGYFRAAPRPLSSPSSCWRILTTSSGFVSCKSGHAEEQGPQRHGGPAHGWPRVRRHHKNSLQAAAPPRALPNGSRNKHPGRTA